MKQNIIVSKLKLCLHCLHIKAFVNVKQYVNGDSRINGKNVSVTNSYTIKVCVIQILMVILMAIGTLT